MPPRTADRSKNRPPNPPSPPPSPSADALTITAASASAIAAAHARLLADSRVALVGTGRAIGAAIHVAETLRRHSPHLAQVTTLRSVPVVDSHQQQRRPRPRRRPTPHVARTVSAVDILLFAPGDDDAAAVDRVAGCDAPSA